MSNYQSFTYPTDKNNEWRTSSCMSNYCSRIFKVPLRGCFVLLGVLSEWKRVLIDPNQPVTGQKLSPSQKYADALESYTHYLSRFIYDYHDQCRLSVVCRGMLRFGPNKVVQFLFLQLKLVENCLTKKSCVCDIFFKQTPPPAFCQNDQFLSQFCFVELTYTKILIYLVFLFLP